MATATFRYLLPPASAGFDVPSGVVTDLQERLVDLSLADTGFFRRVEHPSEGKMLTDGYSGGVFEFARQLLSSTAAIRQ